MVQIVFVVLLEMVFPLVRVKLVTLELHQTVDLNVSLVLNATNMQHVLIKGVKAHVPAHVELTQVNHIFPQLSYNTTVESYETNYIRKSILLDCIVINHNPICSCPRDYVGDPFERCQPKRK